MLARSRLASLTPCLALLGLAGGCQSDTTDAGGHPSVRYEAQTEGTPAELIAHLRVLRDRFKNASAEDLQLLREGTVAYADAVATTADALLASKDANPAQRHEAAEAELKALARPAESDPKALPRLLAAADRLEKEPIDTGIRPIAAFTRFQTLAESSKLRKEGEPPDEALLDKVLAAVVSLGRAEPPHPEVEAILKQFTPLAEAKHRPELARSLYELLAKHSTEPQTARLARGAADRLGMLGKPVAPFAGPRLDGAGTFDLESLKGKVVLVDFWASWCGPCMAEVPDLKGLRDRVGPRGFEILGVSIDVNPEAARAKAAELGMDWPLIDDRGDSAEDPLPKLGARFGTINIPLKLLIDREGKLLASGIGLADVEPALSGLFPGVEILPKPAPEATPTPSAETTPKPGTEVPPRP